jgi:hypothetical protein
MAQQKVMNNFGGGVGTTPASIKQRYWVPALQVAALAFLVGFFVLLSISWSVPLMERPPLSLPTYAKGIASMRLHKAIPFLASDSAEEMRGYLVEIDKRGLGWTIASREWFAAIGALALSGVALWFSLIPRNQEQHMRGRYQLKDAEAIAEANRKLWLENKLHGIDVYLQPGVPVSRNRTTRHILMPGSVGSGKTTILLYIMKQVVDRGDQCLIFDAKGDFTAKLPGPSIMAPWHKDSLVWDIARDIKTIEQARAFMKQVVPEGTPPMWHQSARMVGTGLIMDLIGQRGENWGWGHLYDQFANLDEATLVDIMTRYNKMGLRSVKGAEVTVEGILTNMVAGLHWFDSLARAWGNPQKGKPRGISFNEWLFEDKPMHRQIILQGSGEFEEMTAGYVSAIVDLLSTRMNSGKLGESKTRNIWLFLDELAQMGKVNVSNFVAVGRSKGIRCVFCFQDKSQLDEVLGKEKADALYSMVGIKIFCQMGSGSGAKLNSDMMGKSEIERTNISISGSGGGNSTTTMTNKDMKEVMLESEFDYELGDVGTGVRAIIDMRGLQATFNLLWPYDNTPTYRKAYDEAAWVSAVVRNTELLDYIADLGQEPEGPENDEELEQGPEVTLLSNQEDHKAEAAARLEQAMLGAGPSAQAVSPTRVLTRRSSDPKDQRTGPNAAESGQASKPDASVSTTTRARNTDAMLTQFRQRAEEAKARQLNEERAKIESSEGDGDFAADLHHSHQGGEMVAKMLNLDGRLRDMLGLAAIIPIAADAAASKAGPTDPIMAERLLRQAQARDQEAKARSANEFEGKVGEAGVTRRR